MTDSCRDIREKIEDMLARKLPAGETGAVERHVADCAGCRVYREGLESDDRHLDAFAASMSGLSSRIQDGVLGAAAESTAAGRTGHGMGQTTEPASGHGVHLFDRPSVRVAVAASVIVAIAVISHFSNRTSSSDIIWANVFRQVEESTGCVSRGQVTEDGETLDFVRYESRMYGHKQELYRKGELVHRSYVQYVYRIVTLVQYDDSTYFQDTLGRRTIGIFRKHSALTIVSRMKGREHKNLGISEVNGVTASGIEVADTVAYGDVRYVQIVRLYVDIETQWPVRIEAGNIAGEGVPESNLVIDEFQWHTEFKRADFEADIPDGFSRIESFESAAPGPSASPEIVWDEVFEIIENPPGYVMRSQALRDGRVTLGRDIYYSPEHGTRTDVFRHDTLSSRYIFSVETSRTFSTNFRDRFHYSRSVLLKFVKSMMGYDPLLMIEKHMKKPRKSIGTSEIDGVVVHGVEIDIYNRAHPDKQIGKVRIYADADTEWPLRMEVEGKDSGRIYRMDFRWHPEFTPAMFTPDVPDDFFVADMDDPIEEIIERARVGLRQFALITGRYPGNLWFRPLRRELESELERLKRANRVSAGTADSLESVLYAGVLANWRDLTYREQEYGEQARYDSTVTSADSEKALFRWRIDDKIGVIYGDLRFGYADAAQFAEADSVREYLLLERVRRFYEADSLRNELDDDN